MKAEAEADSVTLGSQADSRGEGIEGEVVAEAEAIKKQTPLRPHIIVRHKKGTRQFSVQRRHRVAV